MNPTFLHNLNVNLQPKTPKESRPTYALPAPSAPIGTGSDPPVTLGRSNNTRFNEVLLAACKVLLPRLVPF